MLTQLLYHHLGETKFDMLKQFYAQQGMKELGTNITASFEDVFQTFQPSFAMKEPMENNQEDPSPNINMIDFTWMEQMLKQSMIPLTKVLTENKKKPIKNNQKDPSPNINMIDFTWMEQMLKQRMVPVTKVLTENNRKLISQMMLLYGLAAHEMEKAVLWALTEENTLDNEELKAACHDLFKTENHKTPVQLTERINQPKQPTNKKPATKEEQLIYELETISPKQLLE